MVYPSPDINPQEMLARAHQQHDDMMAQNRETLKNMVTDGTLGKLDPSFAPLVEFITNNLMPYVDRYMGPKLYDGVRGIAKQTFKLEAKSARRAGSIAENTLRWGMILMRPIMDFTKASNSYRHTRQEIFREFAPVIEATGANAKTNEVIQTATGQAYEEWTKGLKLTAANAITLAPNIYFGLEQQGKRAQHHQDIMKAKRAAKAAAASHLGAEAAPQVAAAGGAAHVEKSKEQKARRKKVKPDDPMMEYLKLNGLASLGTTGGLYVKSRIKDGDAPIIAWDMIKHLRNEMEAEYENRGRYGDRANDNRDPDTIRISTINGSGTISLTDYVVEVFRKNERDHGRADLGAGLREKLLPTARLIAQEIANGRDGGLDAYALVNLVGDNRIIVHKGTSRTFTPESQAEPFIEELKAVLQTKNKVSADEFYANFSDPEKAKKTIDQNLKTLQGKEKVFFESVLPDEILIQRGLKKKDIIALRKEAHGHIYDTMAAAILDLARKEPEHLSKLGLSEEQIYTLTETAEKIVAGDNKIIKAAVDGSDNTIRNAVTTAGLSEQSASEGSETLWTKSVKTAGNLRERIKAHQHRRLNEMVGDATEEAKQQAGVDRSGEGFVDRVRPEDRMASSAVERELKRREATPEEIYKGGPA